MLNVFVCAKRHAISYIRSGDTSVETIKVGSREGARSREMIAVEESVGR